MYTLSGLLLLITFRPHFIRGHADGVSEDVNKSIKSTQWGSYRSNLFFGTRGREEETILTGLMWHGLNDVAQFRNLRHGAEQGDDIQFGYKRNDAHGFGEQQILDKIANVKLATEFMIKDELEDRGWTVQIQSETEDKKKPSKLALYYYIALEPEGKLTYFKKEDGTIVINGNTSKHGDFSLSLRGSNSSKNIKANLLGLNIPSSEHWKIHDYLTAYLTNIGQTRLEKIIQREQKKAKEESKEWEFQMPKAARLFKLKDHTEEDYNMALVQIINEGSFSIDIQFKSKKVGTEDELDFSSITAKMEQHKLEFDEKFDKTFRLNNKGYNIDQIEFAKSSLSNLLGGIGYFHGNSIVKKTNKTIKNSVVNDGEEEEDDQFVISDLLDEDEVEEGNEDESNEFNQLEDEINLEFKDETKSDQVYFTEPSSLFTAVPSRAFFPRGFIWDEGFHQLLISQWDFNLSLEMISSWLNQMDGSGWIAREQILGDEARSKVPPEFQTQYPDYANPPTLFLAIEKLFFSLKANDIHSDPFLDRYSNSEFDHEGLDTTKESLKISKKWLLDMYPKLNKIFKWFEETQYGKQVLTDKDVYFNQTYRWRGRTKGHCLTSGFDDYPRPDVGPNELHVDLLSWMVMMAKVLNKISIVVGNPQMAEYYESHYLEGLRTLNGVHWSDVDQSFCDAIVNSNGQVEHVCHKGYVSILPLALGLINADSDKFKYTLELINNSEELWSTYGIRSLSKNDPNYLTKEAYWRGPIWLNVNYLVLSSLKRNYIDNGPSKELAKKVYDQLRTNLVNNLFKIYESTGFLWENYSPLDGHGQGTRPFTGWSSLIVAIMAEKY